ncbi:MAG: NAD-dependent epimerase/dehydratase family protein [Bacteroidota bacterium]|nr:NAD-dependent epimerase/dehydratase family protein [Bacteroidota bacterium]
MQSILGANGPVATTLAKELALHYTTEIRLVSRHPKKVNQGDEIFAADLLDANATLKAVAGSTVSYFTAGLPMDARQWKAQFPTMMRNVIRACQQHQCKLVFFDNTYMYAKNAAPQTEESPFVVTGSKSATRAQMANMLLDEIKQGRIEAMICRAPEFYGPRGTKSITHSLILQNITKNRALRVPISDRTLRSLIWVPDAARAMALLANTPDAYQQTRHLPCDVQRMTYQQLIALASEIVRKPLPYSVVKRWQFWLMGLYKPAVRELAELLPRYRYDNIFVSDKFKQRFPSFTITTYKEGIERVLGDGH